MTVSIVNVNCNNQTVHFLLRFNFIIIIIILVHNKASMLFLGRYLSPTDLLGKREIRLYGIAVVLTLRNTKKKTQMTVIFYFTFYFLIGLRLEHFTPPRNHIHYLYQYFITSLIPEKKG